MNEKVDKYYDLAYGKRDETNPEEAYHKGHKDRMFILHNLEEIEAYYEDCIQPGSGAQHEGKTEEEILQEAIESISRKITTQEIGKATINTPTPAKREAEQVESDEKIQDNIKEGEEVGDDN